MKKGAIRTYGRHRNRVIVSDAWLTDSDGKENVFGTSSENDSSKQSSVFHISSSSSENSLATADSGYKFSGEESYRRSPRLTRNTTRDASKDEKENKQKAASKTAKQAHPIQKKNISHNSTNESQKSSSNLLDIPARSLRTRSPNIVYNDSANFNKQLRGTAAKRKRIARKKNSRLNAKELSDNFSDFDDYSLTIQDASNGQKKESKDCMETSTPVAKRTRKIIPLKNGDISHIELVVSPSSDTYYSSSETPYSVHYKSKCFETSNDTTSPSVSGLSSKRDKQNDKEPSCKDINTPESVVLLNRLTDSFIDMHIASGDKKVTKHSKSDLNGSESLFSTPARNDLNGSDSLFSTPNDVLRERMQAVTANLKHISLIDHYDEDDYIDEVIDVDAIEDEEDSNDEEEESEDESVAEELGALLEADEDISGSFDATDHENRSTETRVTRQTRNNQHLINDDDDDDDDSVSSNRVTRQTRNNQHLINDDDDDDSVSSNRVTRQTRNNQHLINDDDDDDDDDNSVSSNRVTRQTRNNQHLINDDDDDDDSVSSNRVTRQTRNNQHLINDDEDDDNHDSVSSNRVTRQTRNKKYLINDDECDDDDDDDDGDGDDDNQEGDHDSRSANKPVTRQTKNNQHLINEGNNDDDDNEEEEDHVLSENDDNDFSVKSSKVGEEDQESRSNDDNDGDAEDEKGRDSLGDDVEENLPPCKKLDLSQSRRISFRNASLKNSFSEMLTPTKIKKGMVPIPANTKVMVLCGQTEPISFTQALTRSVLAKCVKIGEGVYGEVFRSISNNQSVAIKVIPIEGDFPVNDEPQKKFDEILPEIVVAKELSDLRFSKTHLTTTYCEVNSVSCVRGKYPATLLKQWDDFHKAKRSENDRPDIFQSNQLFIVFEFADCGMPLDNYKFDTLLQAKSVLTQVTFALAAGEEAFQFEHRDLHWGNVLVRVTDQEEITFVLHGHKLHVPTMGVEASIIDYTMSRLTKDGCKVYSDLSKDDTLFQGKGDYQFDIYRNMKEANGNNWAKFCPYTNVLWLHYLADKLVYRNASSLQCREERDVLRQFRQFMAKMLDYSSAAEMAVDALFLNS